VSELPDKDLFERMVDQVLSYKPPPQAKKAKKRMAARKKRVAGKKKAKGAPNKG
jgi:hypothetical protein